MVVMGGDGIIDFLSMPTQTNVCEALNDSALARKQRIAIWDWVEMSECAANLQNPRIPNTFGVQSPRQFPLRQLIVAAKSCFEQPRSAQRTEETTLDPEVYFCEYTSAFHAEEVGFRSVLGFQLLSICVDPGARSVLSVFLSRLGSPHCFPYHVFKTKRSCFKMAGW